MVVSLKTDLRFPIPGQQGYGSRIIQFILRSKKETYGYSCLTNQKQYYMENYPKIAIEKGTIDEVITMMIRGTEQ